MKTMGQHVSSIAAARRKRAASKKKGTYVGFKALKAKLAARGDVRDPGALAAKIGRQKYGKAGMAALSAAGRHG